jgi:hypothetical protein
MRRLIIKPIFILLGLFVLLSILTLEYWGLFRTINWDKYYFQKIPWKEIILDYKSHTQVIIVFFVIIVIGISAVIVGEKMKNKKKSK